MKHDVGTSAGSKGAVAIDPAAQRDVATVPEWSPTHVSGWYQPEQDLYRCEIRLCSEREGGYSVYVPELPGVVSEGETREEAKRNIAEALRGVLRSYRQDDQPIPWQKDPNPLQEDESRFWIVVNV